MGDTEPIPSSSRTPDISHQTTPQPGSKPINDVGRERPGISRRKFLNTAAVIAGGTAAGGLSALFNDNPLSRSAAESKLRRPEENIIQIGRTSWELNGDIYEVNLNGQVTASLIDEMSLKRGGEKLQAKVRSWLANHILEIEFVDNKATLHGGVAEFMIANETGRTRVQVGTIGMRQIFDFAQNSQESEGGVVLPHEVLHLVDWINNPEQTSAAITLTATRNRLITALNTYLGVKIAQKMLTEEQLKALRQIRTRREFLGGVVNLAKASFYANPLGMVIGPVAAGGISFLACDSFLPDPSHDGLYNNIPNIIKEDPKIRDLVQGLFSFNRRAVQSGKT